MSRRCLSLGVAIAVSVTGLVCACAARPRVRPLQTAPIGDSLMIVRKQLEGTWALIALHVTPPGGTPTLVNAQGTLTYDAYGNLEIRGTVEPTDAQAGASAMLSFKGRGVIDPARKQIKLLDVEGDVNQLAAEVSPDHVRQYEFDAGTLKLTTVDSSGRVTAVAMWRKR